MAFAKWIAAATVGTMALGAAVPEAEALTLDGGWDYDVLSYSDPRMPCAFTRDTSAGDYSFELETRAILRITDFFQDPDSYYVIDRSGQPSLSEEDACADGANTASRPDVILAVDDPTAFPSGFGQADDPATSPEDESDGDVGWTSGDFVSAEIPLDPGLYDLAIIGFVAGTNPAGLFVRLDSHNVVIPVPATRPLMLGALGLAGLLARRRG